MLTVVSFLQVGIMLASFQAGPQMIASVSAFRITKIYVNPPGSDRDMAVVTSGSNQTSSRASAAGSGGTAVRKC